MQPFLICFFQIVLYTLGVAVACGLAVEICYRLCFLLMGERFSYVFWLVTSYAGGAPVHEGGHALMCLLFCHRIDKIRLVPTRAGGALVEHSYKRFNPYAAFGNLWIGLGPILSGTAVILGILCLVYPETMRAFREAVEVLAQSDAGAGETWVRVGDFLKGLWSESTRPLWVRIPAAVFLFSLSLHVRLSVSDVINMLRGLPVYLLLAALAAWIVTAQGVQASATLVSWLRQGAYLMISLFSLTLIFALVLLALSLVCRVLWLIFRLIRA